MCKFWSWWSWKWREWIILIDIKSELAKYGLTEETYEKCLNDVADKFSGVKDYDWSEIININNLDIHYDKDIRKTLVFSNGLNKKKDIILKKYRLQ